MFYNNTPFISSDKTSLIQGHSFPGNSIFFNRAMANMIYPIPKNLPYEDRWFSFVILLNGKMGYLSKPLTFYRQHKNNSWGILNKKELKTFILNNLTASPNADFICSPASPYVKTVFTLFNFICGIRSLKSTPLS